jgi:hypothetical protein
MGSVYVRWEGTCRDRAIQEELAAFLLELADRSAARREGPAPKRPAFLEQMTAQREEGIPPLEPVRLFDQELTGRIVLDPCLAPDGQALYDEVQRTETETVKVEAGGTEKVEAFCLSLGSGNAQLCLRLPWLQVYGIDFQLFDPRGLYPDADRMSFVFLQSAELPSLDGCLAQVESREQCRPYQSEVIRTADWYVSAPSIHLRYYLEEWSDFVLGWVKYFFVPDLSYRRYDDLPQYEAVRTVIADKCQKEGDESTKRAVFRVLIEKFEAEADEWTQKLSDMD